MTPAGLLARALADDTSRPLLTHLDAASGERTEVSLATFDNWVAKTANLLVDGLAVEPGARVALRLPLHWQAVVWVAACWSAGCVAVPGGPAADADVVVAGPGPVEPTGAGDTVALALRPLAAPGPPPPAGVLDYDVEVRAYGDRFTPVTPVPATAPALAVAGAVLDGAAVVAAAEEAVAAWGLGRGDRLLTAWPLETVDGVLAALAAPLATGASAVLWPSAGDAAALSRAVASERAAAVAGVDPPAGSGSRALRARG